MRAKGDALGALNAVLGATLGLVGSARRGVGSESEVCWEHEWGCWERRQACWERSARCWERRWGLLGALYAVLGAEGGVLGALGAVLGAEGGLLGAGRVVLGTKGSVLGSDAGACWERTLCGVGSRGLPSPTSGTSRTFYSIWFSGASRLCHGKSASLREDAHGQMWFYRGPAPGAAVKRASYFFGFGRVKTV